MESVRLAVRSFAVGAAAVLVAMFVLATRASSGDVPGLPTVLTVVALAGALVTAITAVLSVRLRRV